MEVLSSDFSKLVFLRDDRFVEFHARYGRHHQVRIPKVKFIFSLANAKFLTFGFSLEET